MEIQDSERLYMDLKKKLCRLIFHGVYAEGQRIPPERLLAEQFGVSRITVRKALQLLDEEGLLIREIGRGTSVCFPNRGAAGSLDVTALVAPARSTFFSEFIEYFQQYLDQNDTLLLYVQKPEKETIENCLYRLYEKDIRNAVVWPEAASIDKEQLRRLRALGMNLVFFDTDVAIPYADCVYLDNRAAVSSLLDIVRGEERHYCYIGWDNDEIFSVRQRQQYFQEIEPKAEIMRMPWEQRKELRTLVNDALIDYLPTREQHTAFICGAGEIGVETARSLKRLGLCNCPVATVDRFPTAERFHIACCEQDFTCITQQIYRCLKKQNEAPGSWEADCYPIKGINEVELGTK